MKINELMGWTNEHRPPTNKYQHADFENWLDDKDTVGWAPGPTKMPSNGMEQKELDTITSPTKQSTGDEYYWQHQNQLQQSGLHFDAKPIEAHQQKPHVGWAPGSTTVPINSTGHESNSIVGPRSQPTAPDWGNATAYTNKFVPIITELEQALEQNIIGNGVSTSKLTTDPNPQINLIKKQNDRLNNSVQFKNNHLFIQGEQAELTLNLQQFTKEEQKELIRMVQDHLKKKGLVISHLIVNGVRND